MISMMHVCLIHISRIVGSTVSNSTSLIALFVCHTMFVGDMSDSVFSAIYSSAPDALERMELPNELEGDDYALAGADEPLADEEEDGVGRSGWSRGSGPGGCRCRSSA